MRVQGLGFKVGRTSVASCDGGFRRFCADHQRKREREKERERERERERDSQKEKKID